MPESVPSCDLAVLQGVEPSSSAGASQTRTLFTRPFAGLGILSRSRAETDVVTQLIVVTEVMDDRLGHPDDDVFLVVAVLR